MCRAGFFGFGSLDLAANEHNPLYNGGHQCRGLLATLLSGLPSAVNKLTSSKPIVHCKRVEFGGQVFLGQRILSPLVSHVPQRIPDSTRTTAFPPSPSTRLPRRQRACRPLGGLPTDRGRLAHSVAAPWAERPGFYCALERLKFPKPQAPGPAGTQGEKLECAR